jgi:hypothetical protein
MKENLKMRKYVLAMMFILILPAYPQGSDSCRTHDVKAGLELDALPYITGGYYGSAWAGLGRIRIRGVYSKVYQPKFVLPDGFKENRLIAYTVLADYFLNNNFRGPWAGAGFEFWKNNVKTKDGKAEGSFNTYVFTLGGGYVWYFSKHFYLNPWFAGHLRLDNNSNVRFGGEIYKTPRILGEASLKIGFVF